jgi:hypothetical protein
MPSSRISAREQRDSLMISTLAGRLEKKVAPPPRNGVRRALTKNADREKHVRTLRIQRIQSRREVHACDRPADHSLSSFCDTHHEAILRLIQLACENAHKSGIWRGIRGGL